MPLGPLRLSQDNLGKRSPRDIVDKTLAGVDWLRERRGQTFYPVGGAWRAFARIHMSQSDYPLHIIHQYEIAGREARDFAAILAGQSAKSLEKISGVSRRRLETLPTSLLVLERLLAALAPKMVQFSAFGLREGYFFASLPAAERKRDPLIAYAEDEGGRWRRFDLKPSEIFDWLGPLFADERKRDRRLRLAACLLSDLAWAEHPDYRGEQALLRILRMPVPGIDHRERAVLALALMWRYKSGLRGPDAAGARSLIDEDSAATARQIGTTLRLAYNLSGGAPGLLPRVPLRRSKNTIELMVPRKLSNQLGEVTERRLEAAAEAFGCKFQIVNES